MPQVIVKYSDSSRLIIDGSGNLGRNSSNERDSFYDDLLNGERGEDGENSKDITLSLSSNEEKNIIEIDVLDVGFYTLPLNGKIIVKANGGNGGGGNGGNGHKGARGSDGWDASESSYSGNGEDGRAGSEGGNGGNGGNGGKAGNVTIKVKQKDKGLVQLVDIEMKGGDGGYGGRGGEGGQGGPGGEGGHGHTWTEVSVYVNYDGSREQHSYVHSNMGGCNGSVGAQGLPGQQGKKGKRGDNGTLSVEVEKDIEPAITELLQEAPRELSAIKPNTKSTIVDHKRPVKRISDDQVLFDNLLFGKIQPESKEEPVYFLSIKLPTFKNLPNIPKEKEIKTPPDSMLELEMPACTYDPPIKMQPAENKYEKTSEIPAEASNAQLKKQEADDRYPLLGQLIIDSLNKDMARYLSKSIRNLTDVNSEEYKRKLFTDQCELSISNANNEPKQIKIALKLLKEKITKLKAYYSWGSFFSPNSVKKIDELLNRSELQEVVRVHPRAMSGVLQSPFQVPGHELIFFKHFPFLKSDSLTNILSSQASMSIVSSDDKNSYRP